MHDKNVNGYLTRKIFEVLHNRGRVLEFALRDVMEPTLCFYHFRNANLVNPALELSLKFCSRLLLEASE